MFPLANRSFLLFHAFVQGHVYFVILVAAANTNKREPCNHDAIGQAPGCFVFWTYGFWGLCLRSVQCCILRMTSAVMHAMLGVMLKEMACSKTNNCIFIAGLYAVHLHMLHSLSCWREREMTSCDWFWKLMYCNLFLSKYIYIYSDWFSKLMYCNLSLYIYLLDFSVSLFLIFMSVSREVGKWIFC